MTWMIKDENGNQIRGVLSFQIEQSKGKPAILRWTTPENISFSGERVSVWKGAGCMFKGKVYPFPTSFVKRDRTWVAVAIDESFQQQKDQLLSKLNEANVLTGNPKDCEGANAGYIHVDSVTHAVSWVSLENPNVVWDTNGLHESDSVHVIPLDQALKGISASVTLKDKRLESGMMDVGPFIAGVFPHGIETYSGAMLEDQWTKFAYRALRAGYDIHQAELLPLSYRRLDLPKRLNMLNNQDQLVSIPYQSYEVKLLLGWAAPVATHTTVTIETGTSHESLSLSLKAEKNANEDAVVHEMIRWMKAYTIGRSFTAQIKYRLLITDDISLATLGVNAWGILHDSRVHSGPIQGPIVGSFLSNEGGVTWADITMLWAPTAPLQIAETATLLTIPGDPITICNTPNQILESVRMVNGAREQYDYYLRHQSETFETFAKDFPMTQIEISLHPLLNDAVEYLERCYWV